MASNSASEIVGINGIPKPKSLLSSFLFSGFASSEEEHQQLQQTHQMQSEKRSSQHLSLQSNLLPQSLLKDNNNNNNNNSNKNDKTNAPRSRTDAAFQGKTLLLPRPRRAWNISNDDRTALPKVPDYYPPFDPNCTALVTDAPPSIVVVRISECLRKRSIAVEYDDEAVKARCMTVDRCHFEIQLYRSGSSLDDSSSSSLGDALIVEIRKLKAGSSSMSFHIACIKILMAAKGLDSGEDERPARCLNGMEFRPIKKSRISRPAPIGRTKKSDASSHSSAASSYYDSMDPLNHKVSSTAEQALEAALALLKKDRLECQQLGMERLVNLTTRDIVGKEICRYVSRTLLQEQPEHWRLMDLLVHPGAEQASELGPASPSKLRCGAKNKNDKMVRSFLESSAISTSPKKQSHERSSSFGQSFLKKKSLHKRSASDVGSSRQSFDQEALSPEDLQHEARMRALGMRVFCNSLDNLARSNELQHVLYPTVKKKCQPSKWVQSAFLLSLVQDLQGAGRPPSVSEAGYKLASVHEAALAARCLRLLAGYSGDEDLPGDDDDEEYCEDELEDVRDLLRSEPVLERLSYARSCGRATHAILQYEAEQTYNRLTEDVRSC